MPEHHRIERHPNAQMQRITMAESTREILSEVELPDVETLGIPSEQELWLGRLLEGTPGLAELLDHAGRVTAQIGGVIVDNCPVERDVVVALLSAFFGRVDAHGNGAPSRLVFDVTPRRDAQGRVSQAGTSLGAGEFPLHNDSANFETPHTHVLLAAVTSEPGRGGESVLVRADTIADELLRRGRGRSVELLADAVFPFLVGYAAEDELLVGPLLFREGGHWQVRYSQQFVEGGLKYAPLDDDHARAYGDFTELLADPGLTDEFTLRPGDLWVLENRRWLHGRRAIDTEADRLLKRCKVYAPGHA